jgi:hypothetical protein
MLDVSFQSRSRESNNASFIRTALGAEKLEDILRPAGHRSAYFWCEKEAAHHGMIGIEVFHHYMRRITRIGQFFDRARRAILQRQRLHKRHAH